MIALVMSSCSIKQEGPSRVSIQIPSASTLNSVSKSSNKISAMSYDWDNACFMVSVKGEGIPTDPPSACAVEVGAFAGSAGPGQTLSLAVPRGVARKLEVFVYFRASSTIACPTGSSLSSFDPTKTARVGESTFDAQESEINVSVSVSMPSSTTNLITQYSLPASCSTATYVPGTGSSAIAAGRAKQTGGNFLAETVVSGRQSEKVLTGGGFVMQLTRRPNGE